MNTLFISDLHLSLARPEVTTAFCQFLRSRTADTETLYILGDLFEAWIGDDDPSHLARTVIEALRRLTHRGIQLYFISGNRDFAVGRRFARETGCTLLPDQQVVDLYGERALVLHGDTLCTGDAAYQKVRRRVRNPVLLSTLRHLPLWVRRQIAVQGRARSAAVNRNKAEYIMDVAQDAVTTAMSASGVKTLIHGHTHRPGVYPLTVDGQRAQRIVLGDWSDTGWVLVADRNGLRLESFSIRDMATQTPPRHSAQAEIGPE